LLVLPISSTGQPLDFVDALFTATSASCVTGLVVVDTGSALTLFGQLVVLALIQVGGLGIMTLSTIFLLLTGRRLSFTENFAIKDTFTYTSESDLFSLLFDVVRFTMLIEFAGMIIMFLCFLPGRGVVQALYLSVFHAVSAFCNAGFSLFPDSFEAFRGDWIINCTICGLVLCGGIGFLVLRELKLRFPYNRRTWRRLSLHTKLTLSAAGVLILGGAGLILLMEWHNTLSELPVHDRVLAAFFQSVTARTAGFNTIEIEFLANETLFFLIMLMFIGASPGSCGGGIKTGAATTLFVLGFSRLRGHDRPQIFHRTISEVSVARAISVVLVSSIVIAGATLVILMLELGDVSHPMTRGKFLELFFEVVSAFGTVGLSTGGTRDLSVAGKFILTLVMFIGRLGPLVVAVAVSRQRPPRYYYAEETIMVG